MRANHNLTSRFDISNAFEDSPKRRGANRPDIATHYEKMHNITNVRRSHNVSGHGKISDADLEQNNYLEGIAGHNKTSKLRHMHSRKLFGQSLDNVRFFKAEQKRLKIKEVDVIPRQTIQDSGRIKVQDIGESRIKVQDVGEAMESELSLYPGLKAVESGETVETLQHNQSKKKRLNLK